MMSNDEGENNNNQFKKQSDNEFIKQLEKQISDVKKMFIDYNNSKTNKEG